MSQSDVHASNSSAAKDQRTSAIAEGQSQLAALRSGQDLTAGKNDGLEVALVNEAEKGLGSEVGSDFDSSNVEKTRDDNVNVA